MPRKPKLRRKILSPGVIKKAFNVLMENLVTEPVLKVSDFRKTWYLTTDTNQAAAVAVLAQRSKRPVLP